MFGSSKESDKKKDAVNSQRNEIAHGTKIVGDIHFPGTIRFDGEIDGNITCESKIVIGKQGVVNGNLTSLEAEISGNINGVVEIADFLSCTATCVINGDVHYGKIFLDGGAINGKMALKGSPVTPKSENKDGKQNKKVETKAG